MLLGLPEEDLGMVITGASGIDSGKATVIAERALLHALVEKGRIVAFPTRLNLSPLPLKTPTPPGITGEYATNTSLLQVQQQPDGTLSFATWGTTTGWQSEPGFFKFRADGWFTTDENPSFGLSFQTSEGRQYLVQREVGRYGHYQDDQLYAQQVAPSLPLSAVWSGRLAREWLVTNEHPEYQSWRMGSDPRLCLYNVAGHFLVEPHTGSTFPSSWEVKGVCRMSRSANSRPAFPIS
jgi:hypothetical protein